MLRQSSIDTEQWQPLLGRFVSFAFSPITCVPALFLILSYWHLSGIETFFISTIAIIFYGLIPFYILLKLLKNGNIYSLDITNRDRRGKPFLYALFCYSVPLILYFQLFPDFEIMWQSALILFLGALVSAIITMFWKISVHTGSFTLVLLLLIFGYSNSFEWSGFSYMILLTGIFLLGLVSWSRVVVKAHTINQVFVGILIATVVLGITIQLVN